MRPAVTAATSIRRGGPGITSGNRMMTVGTQVSGGTIPRSRVHDQ